MTSDHARPKRGPFGTALSRHKGDARPAGQGGGHLQRLSQSEAVGEARTSNPGPVECRNGIGWDHKSGELYLIPKQTDTKEPGKWLRFDSYRRVGGCPEHTWPLQSSQA